jgi:integrase
VDQVAKLIAMMRTPAYRREVETRLREQAEASGSRKRTRRPRTGDQREDERGYRAWTVRGALTPAGRVFDYARRRMGWAGQNPVRLLDQSERPRSDQRERRVLTGDELERLLARGDGRHRLIFAFAAGTGARSARSSASSGSALDFDAGTVELTNQVDRRGRYVELKTARSRRTVELPTQLVNALRERKAGSGHCGVDGYVFGAVNGTPLEHRTWPAGR